MKLKVGDKVRVRKDLDYGIYTSSDGKCREDIVDDMLECKGNMDTIINIDDFGGIELELNDWRWVDTMFEEVILNEG